MNEVLLSTPVDAQDQIATWRENYNRFRPYSVLGNIRPAELAIKNRLEKLAA